jgi:hypothetical protein
MELAMGLRAGMNCFFVDRRWSPSPNPRKWFGFVVNVLYGELGDGDIRVRECRVHVDITTQPLSTEHSIHTREEEPWQYKGARAEMV